MMIRSFLSIFGIVWLTACGLVPVVTKTESASAVDPSTRAEAMKLTSPVLVVGYRMALDEQQAMETALVEALADRKVMAYRSLDLFPPTREWTEAEQRAVAAQRGIRQIIMAVPVTKDTDNLYVPPTYVPGQTYTQGSWMGNTYTATTYTTPGYVAGGYTVSRPVGIYGITVFTPDDKRRWMARVMARGSTAANFNTVAGGAAREAVKRLVADGLL